MDLVWYRYLPYLTLGPADTRVACLLLWWYWHRGHHVDLIIVDVFRTIPRLLAHNGRYVLHIRNGTHKIWINIYQGERGEPLLCICWPLFRQLNCFLRYRAQYCQLL